MPGDYIYHDGENRRFQTGAWGILRVESSASAINPLKPLPSLSGSVPPLNNLNLPQQAATCPGGAPVHPFAISAVDLPLATQKTGMKAAFVPTSIAAAGEGRQRPSPSHWCCMSPLASASR